MKLAGRSAILLYAIVLTIVIAQWNRRGWTGMYVPRPDAIGALTPVIWAGGPAHRAGVKPRFVEALYPIRDTRIEPRHARAGDQLYVRQGGHEIVVPIERPLRDETIQTRVVLTSGVSLAIFALGMAILCVKGGSAASRRAALMSILLSIWLFASDQSVRELSRGIALGVDIAASRWTIAATLAMALLPAALVHFVSSIPPNRLSPRATLLLYVPSSMVFLWKVPPMLVIVALLGGADIGIRGIFLLAVFGIGCLAVYFIAANRTRVISYIAATGTLCCFIAMLEIIAAVRFENAPQLVGVLLSLVYLVAMLTWAVVMSIRSVRHAPPANRTALAWLSAATLLFGAGLLVFTADSLATRVIPSRFTPFGLVIALCAVASIVPWSIVIAINRFRLFAMPSLFNRYTAVVAFTITLVVVETCWQLISDGLARLGVSVWPSQWVRIGISAALCVLGARPMMERLIRFMAAVPETHGDEHVVRAVQDISMASTHALAAQAATAALHAAIDANVVGVYLHSRKGRWTPLATRGIATANERPIRWPERALRNRGDASRLIPIADVKMPEQDSLRAIGATLVAPCMNGRRTSALLVIGEKLDGVAYSDQEIEVIHTIASVLRLRLRSS